MIPPVASLVVSRIASALGTVLGQFSGLGPLSSLAGNGLRLYFELIALLHLA